MSAAYGKGQKTYGKSFAVGKQTANQYGKFHTGKSQIRLRQTIQHTSK
jgi:hypothetical protein